MPRWEQHSFARSQGLRTSTPTETQPPICRAGYAKLEEDNRLIVHAAANAQRAVDSIIGTTFEDEAETTEETGDAAAGGASEESYASAA